MDLSQISITPGVIPIALQLKEQIRWQIAMEKLRPGDLLPSVRDLSETLGIARNTINAVYDELRAEGLITMGRGRGTEIADTEKVRQLPRLTALLNLIDESVSAASALGFCAADIAPALQVRAQLLLAEATGGGAVTLVECPDHEVEFYMRQVRELTGRPVRLLDLESFRKNPGQAGQAFVTSCFHGSDVRAVAGPDVDVAYLGASPDLKIIMQLALLAPGTNVLFVGRSGTQGAWMERTVSLAGIDQLTLTACGIRDAALPDLLAGASVVYATPSTYPEVLERAPQSVSARLFELVLDLGSQERLRSFAPRS